MQTTVIVVGGGIGGLATALALHDRGVSCRVYEQSPEIRELGVGINTLPHAIGERAALGLLDRLDAVGLRTYELIYMNRSARRAPTGASRTSATLIRTTPPVSRIDPIPTISVR